MALQGPTEPSPPPCSHPFTSRRTSAASVAQDALGPGVCTEEHRRGQPRSSTAEPALRSSQQSLARSPWVPGVWGGPCRTDAGR